MENKPRIIFLVGPTAVGKTSVSLHLALKIKAEVISCDSMQVYKKMDIISSKPELKIRNKLPHYLVDILSPQKEYNVATYRKEGLKKIKDIIKREKAPLLVGGTGLYMSILVDGIFNVKTQDENIRKELYAEADSLGSPYLYKKLQKIDAPAALKIHPNDTKRIIRALEVFLSTGKLISELQKKRIGLYDLYDVRIFCLNMDRDKLYSRIDERVDEMFKKGLLSEVRELLKLKLSKTASCAIGIKELKAYYEGLLSLEEAKELMKKNTRNYAKRQLTWFRKDKRIQWVEVDLEEKPLLIANRIIKLLKM